MLRKFSTYTFALLALTLLFTSCKKEYESIQNIDEAKIQQYLTANNLQFDKDPSGFYYKIEHEGTGDSLTLKDSVFYNFNIKSLSSGAVYQDSTAGSNSGTYVGLVQPSSYVNVMTKLERGDKFTIILPSYLAFGKNGNGNIPSNEVVISEISTFEEASQAAVDETRIKAYLKANGLTGFNRDPSSGIYYLITLGSGAGGDINLGSTVTAKYTGKLLNGTVFDSSTDGTASFSLARGGVIEGWRKILPMLNVGDKVRMFIPSGLAYADAPPTADIPVNAVLDFDVEVTGATN